MTRGEALAISLVILTAAFSLLVTIAAAWLNRRMVARDDVVARLTAMETKVNLMDVGGTHANRAAIEGVRRDLVALDTLHRRDVEELGDRIGSLGLSIATTAERLNGYSYGLARRGRQPDPDPAASTG